MPTRKQGKGRGRRRRGLMAEARRRCITRGLMGDSNFWLLIGILAWGVHGLRRALTTSGKDIKQVIRLLPGDRLTVRSRR